MALVEIASVHAATLHDALQRAIKVAPTKGAAWDRAQGIHLTFQAVAGVGWCEVRATDTETTYWQQIAAQAASQEPVTLRLPSMPLAPFVAGLPMNEDEHRVRFLVNPDSPKECIVQFMRSKIKAKMMVITSSYPEFGPLEIDGMGEAQELASRIEQVSWACDKHGKMAGIYLDGDYMVGACTKQAARAHCKVETDHPVVAPLGSLSGLIKVGTQIRMGVHENRLVLALDEASQVTTSLILEQYPDVAKAMSVFPLECKMLIPKTRVQAAMDRLLLFVRNDRLPRCAIDIFDNELWATLETEGSKAQDVIEITSSAPGERRFIFNPQIIRGGLESFGGAFVEVHYSAGQKLLPWHLVDPSGDYECWLMPMADNAMSQPEEKVEPEDG